MNQLRQFILVLMFSFTSTIFANNLGKEKSELTWLSIQNYSPYDIRVTDLEHPKIKPEIIPAHSIGVIMSNQTNWKSLKFSWPQYGAWTDFPGAQWYPEGAHFVRAIFTKGIWGEQTPTFSEWGENVPNGDELKEMRRRVIENYILNLEKGDAQSMLSLFTENGEVVSTSRGRVDANRFFSSFLPQIKFAKTEIHQWFFNKDKNLFGVRFHFNYQLVDGETGDGEYVDEFSFADNAEYLSSVYMFENLKFTQK